MGATKHGGKHCCGHCNHGDPYDAAVIGAGPAGVAAAVTLAGRGVRTLLVGERFAGPPGKTDPAHDWLTPASRRTTLARAARAGLPRLPLLTARIGHRVTTVRAGHCGFAVEMEGEADESAPRARTVLLATGAAPRQLGVPGEQRLAARGVSYCIACDAPYFAGKRVVVVCDDPDGGETAVEDLAELRKYARTVTILTDPAAVSAIEGSRRVEAIRVRRGSRDAALKTDGVFIQLGQSPNTEPFRELLGLRQNNQNKYVPVDPQSGATKVPGVFAAGDLTDHPLKSSWTALGDGTRAALALAEYLNEKEQA